MNRSLNAIAWGLLVAAGPAATAEIRSLDAETWSRPRDGAALLAMPALRATVREHARLSRGRISIRHPRGEEGLLWAEELKGWLVALGVGSDAIVVEPGAARLERIELTVTPAGPIRSR